MHTLLQNLHLRLRKHKKILLVVLAAAVLALAALMITCYSIIEPYEKHVVSVDSAQSEVGIVLGAGVADNGEPYDELKARLDVAAGALESGAVDKLILSGDNRLENYNEPLVMKNYLMESKNVSEDKLFPDYAGRSTYESCERAAKIFGVKQVVVFSAGSHLPRALYLCRHFGIQAYGISSGVEANNSTRREILARVKAIYNTHIIGERTVLGDPIPLN